MVARVALSELKRGLSLYSLGVSALIAMSFTLALHFMVRELRGLCALALSGAMFFGFVTTVHAFAHAYFGWRLGRGLQALSEGRHQDSLRLLSVFERIGVEHYDQDLQARHALASVRSAPDAKH